MKSRFGTRKFKILHPSCRVGRNLFERGQFDFPRSISGRTFGSNTASRRFARCFFAGLARNSVRNHFVCTRCRRRFRQHFAERAAAARRFVRQNCFHEQRTRLDARSRFSFRRGDCNVQWQEMNEDYGNLDRSEFFCGVLFQCGSYGGFDASARHQTNEVVLDNDDAGVSFAGSWANTSSTIYWAALEMLHIAPRAWPRRKPRQRPTLRIFLVVGFYPVYCWTRHGADRGDQLYRIRHTGGESQVRIPHYRVGNGWVYLGEYYFNAGANATSGSVVISNFRGSPTVPW